MNAICMHNYSITHLQRCPLRFAARIGPEHLRVALRFISCGFSCPRRFAFAPRQMMDWTSWQGILKFRVTCNHPHIHTRTHTHIYTHSNMIHTHSDDTQIHILESFDNTHAYIGYIIFDHDIFICR
jgi:hypothetical protein